MPSGIHNVLPRRPCQPEVMEVHVVPVGFDYDRLIAPLVRDKVDVDRAVLLQGAVGSEDNVEHSEEVARRLREDFESLLDAETETLTLDDVYDYDATYVQAYRLLRREHDAGNSVHVNVSAMPRTVSFAFAMAAQTVMLEDEDARDSIQSYYTAPEKYLETEMAEELERVHHLIRRLKDEGLTDSVENEIDRRFQVVDDLTRDFRERGTTVGIQEIDGSHVAELPVQPLQNPKPFERSILHELDRLGTVESTSDLAEALAEALDEEYDDAFRSKVIYNVRSLREKDLVEQTEEGKSHRTRLSRLGRLWVDSHEDHAEKT